MSTNTAFARLKSARGKITKQQYRTLKGQILAGDVDGAMKGLRKIFGGIGCVRCGGVMV